MNRYIFHLAACYGCATSLPPEERVALEAWENENLANGSGLSTSDWPGFVKYLGPKPEPEPLKTTSRTSGFVYRM